ncbi:ABC-2 type transport system permease protein [Asanoa ferruginea]|uniref:ABC-2 type transport system permease protein n=1 Tax=Asanoa ferruginea TaxID=53367 RepID=A0A3D9ZCN2_9ACTN|nr:ABC transporter permease subunit [Asanoa ferruginea]REF95176.1 ABC-2 type transport system permease protein [Asanoa ferruginea]GIF53408.1 membrane protein [Asanoa ferruginea]
MSSPAGVIHDIGYQRYAGARLGRRDVVLALYTQSLRTVFGLGRSFKAKIFPWFVVGVAAIVAIVVMAIRAQTGEVVIKYADYPQVLGLLMILFVAIAAPELVSRDLHSGVLPLYFSRPLRPGDYALAKLAALVSGVMLVFGGGQLLIFIGAAFSVKGFSNVMNELGDVGLALIYTALYGLVFGSMAVLVASLLKRRAVAAAAIVGTFIVTAPIVAVLATLPSERAHQLAQIVNPVSLVGGVGDWLFEPTSSSEELGIGPFGPLYALVTVLLVALCVTLLIGRYRKVSKS